MPTPSYLPVASPLSEGVLPLKRQPSALMPMGQGLMVSDLQGSDVINKTNRLPGFGAGGFSVGKKPAKRLADKMFYTFMQNNRFGEAMNGVGRKFNMSIEDWMGRMSTAIALYIPQVVLNFTDKDGLPFETLGRNLLSWFGTIWLYSFIKNDKTSINSMFLDWFMSEDKTKAKNKDGTLFKYKSDFTVKKKWLKPLEKPFQWIQRNWSNGILKMQRNKMLPKGLSFDPNDLYRAAGIRVGEKPLPWSRVSLEQAEKLKRVLKQFDEKFGEALHKTGKGNPASPELQEKLSQFFNFFTHEEKLLDNSYASSVKGEKGLVEFSRRIQKEGLRFLKRINKLTNLKNVIQTILFTFFIGDLVMRIVWATFSKLDHHEGSRSNPNKKPQKVDLFKYRSLPSRLVSQSLPVAQPQTQQANQRQNIGGQV